MKELKFTRRKEVTFSPDEWERLISRANSASLKPGTYIRWASLNTPVKFYSFPELTELLGNLRVISKNINLLAKKANEFNAISEGDHEEMKEEMLQLYGHLDHFISERPRPKCEGN